MVMRAMDAMYHDLESPARKRSIGITHSNKITDGTCDDPKDQDPPRQRLKFTTDLKESTTDLKEYQKNIQ